MLGINKVILIGNLGRDPEFKYTPAGRPVATFTLATTERYNDNNGQRQDRTEWHNIVVWGRQAELVNQYLKKGRSAYIEGRITTRSWDDRDGNKKYKTEIVANTIQFIGGGASGSGPAPQDSGSAPSNDDFGADAGPAGPAGPEVGGVAEDDLPF